MAERITITNLEGAVVGTVHINNNSRVGHTVYNVTTQINGGGFPMENSSGQYRAEIPVTDALGRVLPQPVAKKDLAHWEQLQARRTPADIDAIKNMPLRSD